MTRTFAGFDRITTNPEILGGRPCVRGMRLSVVRVLEILSLDPHRQHVHEDYPELEPEDLAQVLRYAAASLETDHVVPLASGAV